MAGNSDAKIIGSIIIYPGQQIGMKDFTLSNQMNDAIVVGRVFYGGGNPVQGAIVAVVKYDVGNPGETTPISHTTSGFDGYYLLKISPGDYTNSTLVVVASYPFPQEQSIK